MTITNEASLYLNGLFIKKDPPKGEYWTSEELEHLGRTSIKNLKRRTLGLCGRSTIKSLDEITEVLLEMNLVQRIDDAEELISRLAYFCRNDLKALPLYETLPLNCDKYLMISEVKRPNETNVKYKISVVNVGRTPKGHSD